MSVKGKTKISFFTHIEDSTQDFPLTINGKNYENNIETIDYTDSLDDSADSMDITFNDPEEILFQHIERSDVVSALIEDGGEQLETGRMQVISRDGSVNNQLFNITCTSMNQVRDSINNRFSKFYSRVSLEGILKDACKKAKLQVRVSPKFKNIKFKRVSRRGIAVKNLIKEYADKFGAILKFASYGDGLGGIRTMLFFMHRDDFKDNEPVWNFYKNKSKDAMANLTWQEQPLSVESVNFSYTDYLSEETVKGSASVDYEGAEDNNPVKVDSEAEAILVAEAIKNQSFLDISFTTEGFWEYRAGNNITLEADFGNLLKGLYLIKKVDHEVTRKTWKCTIKATKLD